MSNPYSLNGDPVYSQIDQVMSQLRNPTSSGLESLLMSKSKLDEMGEEYGKKDELEDTYYYYYYEEENPNFSGNNDLNPLEDRRVTDNYAVEHLNREFIVLPDGSPVPNSFFGSSGNQELQTTTIYDGDKYFHTGMLDGITKDNRKDAVTETLYHTPTWYQRPTTPKINLLKPELPVASITVYDPLTHFTDDELTNTELYKKIYEPDQITSPTRFTLNDLTTLASINPDDEYNLKHDGVQWVFLKNSQNEGVSSGTAPPTSAKLHLPHEIKIASDSVTGNKPHLIFKHPSGTVTEMHISPGKGNNSKEKIITVIETGPVTQNYTKIKINNISELDKVIENVFDVSSIDVAASTLTTETTKYTHRKPTHSTFTTSPVQYFTPENTFYTSVSPEDLKVATSNGIDEELFTTIYDTRITSKPPTTNANRVLIRHVKEKTSTKLPGGTITRIIKLPQTTKPTPTRHSTSQILTTKSPRPLPTVRYTKIPATSPGTSVPTRVYTMIRQGNTKPSVTTSFADTFVTETQEPEIEMQETIPTIQSIIVKQSASKYPFEAMINNIGEEDATTEPLFSISTKTNGKITTKSYTTVQEAMADLTRITTQTVSYSGTPTSRPEVLRFSTVPMSVVSDAGPTQTPLGDTTIPEDLRNLIANSDNEDVAYFNNNACEDSFLRVNDFKICDELLRSEPLRNDVKGKLSVHLK